MNPFEKWVASANRAILSRAFLALVGLLFYMFLYSPTQANAGTYYCPSGGTLSGAQCITTSSYGATTTITQCPITNKCVKEKVSPQGICTWSSTWRYTNPVCGVIHSRDVWDNSDTSCSPCQEGSDTSTPVAIKSCPSGGVLSGSTCVITSSYNASYTPSACNLPWGGSIAHGQSTIGYNSSSVPFGSSCAQQTRTCNDGYLSGNYANPSCSVQGPAGCSSSFQSWGAGNFCGATASASPSGTPLFIANGSGGATGGATATCFNGSWTLSGTSCNVNLAIPSSISATDGALDSAVAVTWGSVLYAQSYSVRYRKGNEAWVIVPSVNSGWQHSTTDESIFEYQVRANNAVGSGDWSPSDMGNIRPLIFPVFVSQVIPTDVKIGELFSATQVWSNQGATTWTNADFYLTQAPSSDSFGSAYGFFTGSVAFGQQGTSTFSLVAPMTPGIYNFSRRFNKSGAAYGSPSTPFQVRVWGPPVCNNLTANKTSTYDVNEKIIVTYSTTDQTTAVQATAWSEVNGQDDVRSYTPSTTYSDNRFEIPLNMHSGFGVYRVKVELSNIMSSTTCETEFTLIELDTPVATLQDLVGKDGSDGFVVGQVASTPIINSTVTRTNSLGLAIDLVSAEGAVSASAVLEKSTESVSISGVRWIADVWSAKPYSLRISYTEPGAVSQNKTLTIPIRLILSPAGTKLSLSVASGHPFDVRSVLGLNPNLPYDAAKQGAWKAMVAQQGGAELDAFELMVDGQRIHTLNYDELYGKSLTSTVQAIPPSSTVLRAPLEITTTVRLPVLPVRNLIATDGTLEDIVRVTWDAPAQGGTGFTYDVYRDSEIIANAAAARMLEDAPPIRGKIYQYKVIATHALEKSGDSMDPGHIPLCRAARLIGASLNADMSSITGLIEQWACVAQFSMSGSIDMGSNAAVATQGSGSYKAFSIPLTDDVKDGAHMLRLTMNSDGVLINAVRTYDVPFTLSRALININKLTILYNGAKAIANQEANSIGRFGLKMEGGAGIGFAEEIK